MKLESIVYYSSGLYSLATDESLSLLRSDKYTVIFVLCGALEMQLEHSAVTVRNKEVFFLTNENNAHMSVSLPNQKQTDFFWAQFDEMPDDLLLPTHMLCENAENLRELFNQLHYFSKVPNHQNAAQNLLLRLILIEINLQYTSLNASRELSTSQALPLRIYDYIRKNADKKITVEDVAIKFGYNRDYLTRIMKKEGFPGIKQLIISTRCDYIKALLSTTELSIKEIGIKTGFECTNDFLKFFKTHENITPTEFRELRDKAYSHPQNQII